MNDEHHTKAALAEVRTIQRAEEQRARNGNGAAPRKAPAPTAFDVMWRPLDAEALLREPAPRRWVLRHPTRDGQPCAPHAGDGLLPLGKIGGVVSDGGVGKTATSCALGVSLVTGVPWLGHFQPEPSLRGRRVLLALAEEDEDEVPRLLHRVCSAYDLDADQRRRVAAQVVVLPLAGRDTSLVAFGPDGRSRVASPGLEALRRKLKTEAGDEGWSLVVLDPLGHFSDDESEKDNGASRRVLQLAATLTEAPGNPTTLFAHHASLVSTQTGDIRSRGPTAIRNTFRWEGVFREEGDDVFFQQRKSNYSRRMRDELRLVRGPHGILRVPTAAEAAQREDAAEQRALSRAAESDKVRDLRNRTRLAGLVEKVVAAASDVPRSKTELGAAAGLMGRADIVAAVAAALASGRLQVGAVDRGHDRYVRSGAA